MNTGCISRSRIAVRAVVLAAMAALAAAPLQAQPTGERHGLSTFGELKYPPDFKHFDYVNPDAPKGGRLSQIGNAAINTFDSFNPFVLKGNPAQGLGLLFDTLMVAAGDEPASVYGLVARTAQVADDKMSVTFRLRPEAKFSDGKPVTAEDVAFSFDILKSKGHPAYRLTMKDISKAEVLDPLTVKFAFTGTLVRDLPLVAAGLPVLSKAFYAANDFEAATMQVQPVGSGPYVVGDYASNQHVTYRRRPDYWARDLPVNRGRYNFDEIRYEYFKDRAIGLENLKSGTFDLREEFTSKDWATAYDVPAVRDGRLIRLELPDESPSGAQGFFFNMRRSKFADPRVRKALDYAFDYEWTNANLFFGLYKRTHSYFENSELKATGMPSPAELALLEPHRAKLPAEVFGEPYVPPVTDGSGQDRKVLGEASRLLTEAGWVVKGGKRVNAKGEVLTVEFLITPEPTSERLISPYVQNLLAIGVQASIRRVDAAQYELRQKTFDFDIITRRTVMSLTPGIELQNYFGSEAADIPGSRNITGIKNPVLDALVVKVMEAKSRDELVTAVRAMDRVLRAGHYWVPHWYKAAHHIAYWDKFGRPAVKPKYDRGILDTWWFDARKAAALVR